MKNKKYLRYCKFIPDGSSNFKIVLCLIKWVLFCWLRFYRWLVIVETKAAGKNAGKHKDLYVFKGISNSRDVLDQIKEDGKMEKIYLIDCLNGGMYEG